MFFFCSNGGDKNLTVGFLPFFIRTPSSPPKGGHVDKKWKVSLGTSCSHFVSFFFLRLLVAVDLQHVFVAVHAAPRVKTQQQQELCTPSSFSWEQFCLLSCSLQALQTSWKRSLGSASMFLTTVTAWLDT